MADESLWSLATAIEVIKAGAGDVANICVMESGGLEAARSNFQLCAAAGTSATRMISLPADSTSTLGSRAHPSRLGWASSSIMR